MLALQEQIGIVCTGLSEQTILERMQAHRYRSKRRGYLVKGSAMLHLPCENLFSYLYITWIIIFLSYLYTYL